MTYSEFCVLPEGQRVKVKGIRCYKRPCKVGPTIIRPEYPEGAALLHFPGKQVSERTYIDIRLIEGGVK